MNDLTERVAVITGAASGIGKGMAERCTRLGMKVVLADVDESALAKVEKRLRAKGAQALAFVTDVSEPNDLEKLAAETMDAFGAVHLLVNNASATGLASYSLSAPYQASKHGVVSLSEHLHYSLRERTENIGVSALCSAWVATRILSSGRNRPDDLANSAKENSAIRKSMQPYGTQVRQAVRDAMPVKELVDCVFHAIEGNQFYIVPHPELTDPQVQRRMEGILDRRTPPETNIDELLFLGH